MLFPKQTRDEVEYLVRKTIAENQSVERDLDTLPKDISEAERWKRFRERARASKLYVRRPPPEEDQVDTWKLMYLVDKKEGGGVFIVIMTYADGNSVGEFFEVELSRIVAVT